jgi:hypothetical protein
MRCFSSIDFKHWFRISDQGGLRNLSGIGIHQPLVYDDHATLFGDNFNKANGKAYSVRGRGSPHDDET